MTFSKDNPLGDFQLFPRSSGSASGFSFKYISSRASLRYSSSPAFFYLTQEDSSQGLQFHQKTTCMDSSTFKVLLLKTL